MDDRRTIRSHLESDAARALLKSGDAKVIGLSAAGYVGVGAVLAVFWGSSGVVGFGASAVFWPLVLGWKVLAAVFWPVVVLGGLGAAGFWLLKGGGRKLIGKG